MNCCKNNNCEYNEDEICEYEGNLLLDENGLCERFRNKIIIEDGE